MDGGTIYRSLKATVKSYANNPVTSLVSLGAIVLTTFLKCVFWGCDVGMQSGWVFFREIILPGLVVAFVATFVWNLWKGSSI